MTRDYPRTPSRPSQLRMGSLALHNSPAWPAPAERIAPHYHKAEANTSVGVEIPHAADAYSRPKTQGLQES